MLRITRLRTSGVGGRRLVGALALAAAVLCAAATLVTAQVSIDGRSGPPSTGGETIDAGLDPTTGSEPAAGSTGVWDPALNRFRDPSGEELAVLTERSLMARSGRPQVEKLADGSLVLRVPEEGFGATWGHLHPDGAMELHCAHTVSKGQPPSHHPTVVQEEE